MPASAVSSVKVRQSRSPQGVRSAAGPGQRSRTSARKGRVAEVGLARHVRRGGQPAFQRVPDSKGAGRHPRGAALYRDRAEARLPVRGRREAGERRRPTISGRTGARRPRTRCTGQRPLRSTVCSDRAGVDGGSRGPGRRCHSLLSVDKKRQPRPPGGQLAEHRGHKFPGRRAIPQPVTRRPAGCLRLAPGSQ